MTDEFDDLVIGAGMGGLTVGALLARSGRRVCVLEAHDQPGGYAHTFTVRGFKFCAQVHYIFNCGEGEPIHDILVRLGLSDEVPFERLDPEGFDHVVVEGARFRIPSGLSKFRERLLHYHPHAAEPIRRYFQVICALGDELDQLGDVPDVLSAKAIAKGILRFRHVVRYMRWTLGDLFEHVKMPENVRAILAGQCGDYLLPPRDVSLLLHVALVVNYDRGAYYPKHHYVHFVEAIAGRIRDARGSALLLEHEVDHIVVEGGRVSGVTTKNGKRFTAKRYVSNVDPRLTAKLAGETHFGKDERRLRYDYSCGTFTIYLALRGLDLREHGFGSHNTWHYPHADIDRVYDDQLVRNDLSDPWLFLSTPTLHSSEPGLCPPDHQILEIATACDHDTWARLRQRDRRAYNKEKKKVRERILDVLEERYVPKLREHVALSLSGTPATNARFCRAPAGNSYGAALTPANVGFGRGPWRSSLSNLWMVNATAGFPSVAGTMGAGLRLYETLSGSG